MEMATTTAETTGSSADAVRSAVGVGTLFSGAHGGYAGGAGGGGDQGGVLGEGGGGAGGTVGGGLANSQRPLSSVAVIS